MEQKEINEMKKAIEDIKTEIESCGYTLGYLTSKPLTSELGGSPMTFGVAHGMKTVLLDVLYEKHSTNEVRLMESYWKHSKALNSIIKYIEKNRKEEE